MKSSFPIAPLPSRIGMGGGYAFRLEARKNRSFHNRHSLISVHEEAEVIDNRVGGAKVNGYILCKHSCNYLLLFR